MSHHSRKISSLLLLCFPLLLFAVTALGQGINEVSSLPIITTHPRGGVFDFGSSIFLRCQAQNANLSPVFTHNGVLIDERDPIRITSTEGLTIPNFVSGFEGEYVCLVRNLAGNVTFTVASAPALVQLRVLEATLFSSELSAPHNVTIRVCQPAIIDCASSYNSIPAPTFDWRFRRPITRSLISSDNMVIGLNGSLYIRDPMLSQNLLVLECTITNGGQLIMSGYIQLIVDSMSSPAAPPQILSPPRDVALVFNQDVIISFECIVGGSPLQPVTWRTSVPEGRIFTNPVFDNNQIQVILQESDAGAMFTCSVATVGNFSAQLAFIDPPRLTSGLLSSTQVIDYGSPLSLSCSSDSLAITWYWFRNGTRLNEFSGPQLSTTVEEDSSSYQCYAINDAGIASSQTYVQVRTIPASITSSLPPQQIVFSGSPISLGCSATGAPPPTYQWIKDGVPLAESSAQFQVNSNTGSLTIGSIDNTFNGNYTCRATNRIGDRVIGRDEISTTLTIITPTTFTQSIGTEPMLSILLEAKDTLFCDVSRDSGSLLQFLWTKDDQTLVVDGTRLRYADPSLTRSGSINITRVLNEDAGVYVCTVTTTYNGLPAPTIRTQPSQVVVTGQEYTTESDTSLCNDGEVRLFEVRLFDGENFNQREGRVEMCFNGVWGAVCADGWDEVAANIVCTQLGYENGLPLGYRQSIPTLFYNITCNETHSMLFQCVNLHSIGVYNCGGDIAAGVICLNTIVTATPTSVAGLSSTYIAILSGSLGTAVLVIMVILIVSIAIIVYIQRMKTKRSKRNSATTDVPMKDNEAYATLSASHHVKTQPNEAYETLVL